MDALISLLSDEKAPLLYPLTTAGILPPRKKTDPVQNASTMPWPMFTNLHIVST